MIHPDSSSIVVAAFQSQAGFPKTRDVLFETVSRLSNPYWEAVSRFPRNEIAWHYDHVWEPDWLSVPYEQYEQAMSAGIPLLRRDDLCVQYAWAIPDPASLAFVARALGPQAVEIGAGTGYWASLLSQLGVDILCYDQHPPQLSGQNHWHSPRTRDNHALLGETREIFFDVREGGTEMAANHSDRTLFLCWPPLGDPMAFQALQAYQGSRLVFIGESGGGCTADDDFFKLLEETWHCEEDHRPLQWHGVHDYITLYERGKESEDEEHAS
jgi:hypothetical protein